jgi:hypothetical protein
MVRAIALLGAGSAAIHQLRYAIGTGHSVAPNHGYLALALPAILIVTILALAAVLLRVARGSTAEPSPAPLAQLWLACALALAAIYGVQESLEGAGAIAAGGWIGLALSIPGGLLIAVALRGASRARVAPLHSPTFSVLLLERGSALREALGVSRLAAPGLGARAPPFTSVA